eukprot:9360469-Pyramimonas_sp.AAC.1
MPAMKSIPGPTSLKRACFDIIFFLLSPRSRKLAPRFKAILQTLVAQGWWTEEKLSHLGYDVPNVCPLCQDTLHHRLYRCRRPGVEALGAEFLPPEVLRAALEAPENSPLYCYG